MIWEGEGQGGGVSPRVKYYKHYTYILIDLTSDPAIHTRPDIRKTTLFLITALGTKYKGNPVSVDVLRVSISRQCNLLNFGLKINNMSLFRKWYKYKILALVLIFFSVDTLNVVSLYYRIDVCIIFSFNFLSACLLFLCLSDCHNFVCLLIFLMLCCFYLSLFCLFFFVLILPVFICSHFTCLSICPDFTCLSISLPENQ